MTADQDSRDRSARGASLEDHLRHPDDMAVTVAEPEALVAPAEKSLFQLSSELKNLIRGDRIFRAGAKR